jgi:hypothetical protein
VTKLSVVLSTHAASFDAVALKGDFDANVAKIARWGYDGVELAIRDPRLVVADQLKSVVGGHGLAVPAIGTGQAWGEEKLSFTSDSASVSARSSGSEPHPRQRGSTRSSSSADRDHAAGADARALDGVPRRGDQGVHVVGDGNRRAVRARAPQPVLNGSRSHGR